MFKNITLEISLKPFKKTDEDYIRSICKKVFSQWAPLLKGREVISIMLWASDGSEILDYAGNMDDTFEWCYYLGTANHPLLGKDERKDTSLHDRTQVYMENPPVMTYRILKNIIRIFKEEGKIAFPDSVIRVGETFDIGPEFSRSDFKYNRHTEITGGATLDHFGFIDSTSKLDGDDRCYAAYPEGIPEGTPFATFLGKQSNIFLEDMDFDYLWLSNGLGFSPNPWDLSGKIYDGENFFADKLEDTANQVFNFWRLFREACPDYPLEVRGTNNSVGIDYATDGVPLYDIYNSGFNITPPPNSPWAALNDDFGLEIMGHMNRICNLPCDEFMFRFYIHDPWWINSPWYDRYSCSPHDIYLPMAVSRIDEKGEVKSAETLNILSIDNSFGDMPDNCVYEPLPHLLNAEKNIADKPAPFVWVYPMKEYTTSKSEQTLKDMYFGDNYIKEAINSGFPLNCVVSTDNFLKTPLSVYKASVLVSPIPETIEVFDKLCEFEKNGGNVVYYGNEFSAEKWNIYDFIDYNSSPDAILKKVEEYGYYFNYIKKTDLDGKMVLAVSPSDGALWFSAYNALSTTETELRFPLGAPILSNRAAEMRDYKAVYHFQRGENTECRIFVDQKDGVVACKEDHPVSTCYHRKMILLGLENANVCIFPEKGTNDTLKFSVLPEYTEDTPIFDERFKRIVDEKYGVYYKAENISGDYLIMLPKKHK